MITLESQLEPRAQRQATKIYGFNETHRGVLSSTEVAALVNSLLAQVAP